MFCKLNPYTLFVLFHPEAWHGISQRCPHVQQCFYVNPVQGNCFLLLANQMTDLAPWHDITVCVRFPQNNALSWSQNTRILSSKSIPCLVSRYAIPSQYSISKRYHSNNKKKNINQSHNDTSSNLSYCSFQSVAALYLHNNIMVIIYLNDKLGKSRSSFWLQSSLILANFALWFAQTQYRVVNWY